MGSSKDLLQLLFAGKEPQVRAAGQGHPGMRVLGNQERAGALSRPCHAWDPDGSGA